MSPFLGDVFLSGERLNCFSRVWDSNAAAMCEFAELERQGEHREAGLREISVRKFTCSRIPPPESFDSSFAKAQDSLKILLYIQS